MRRLVALVVLALSLGAPGAALADDGRVAQEVIVGQASQATSTALPVVVVDGGACFAGCPTIVVAPATAVAFSLNLAVVTQLLSQIALQP
jgi:hypothetical protein